METIELDIDSLKKPQDVQDALKSKSFVNLRSCKINLYYSDEPDELYFASFLFFFTSVLIIMTENNEKPILNSQWEKYHAIFHNGLFTNHFDTNNLLEDLKKSLGINYKLVHKNRETRKEHVRKVQTIKKKSPLDEMFGLWQDRDISLEKIREQAWPKRN